MIDINSPDFEAFLDKKLKERLKPIEDKIDSYKLSMLKETLVTKDEFKEETQKQHEENTYNFKKLELSILDLQNKSGPALERLVLDLMRETLKIEKIDINKIRREFIIDKNGDIFKKNESVDIDILMENGNVYLVEVKATADRWDAWRLILTGRLYEKINNRPPTQLILIAFRMKQEYIEDAKQNNIRVIVGEVI